MPLDTAPAANRAAVDQILKEFYLGPIREQLNSETLLSHRLQKNSENVEGRVVVIPLHTGRNVGIQAALEGALLPDPGNQVYTDMRFNVRYNYGRIKMSGPALASARTQRGAFIRVLDSEVKGMVRDFKNDLNRQRFGDASGRLATVDNIAAAPTYGVREVWDSAGQGARLKHVRVGDRLAYENVPGGGLVAINGANFVAVTAINLAGKTVTFAASAGGVAVGDHFVKGNSTTVAVATDDSNFRGHTGGTPNEAKEVMGLVGLCSGANGWPENSALAYVAVPDGQVYAGADAASPFVYADLQNVDSVTATPEWNANMFFNSGVPRPLTTDLWQQAFDASEEIGQATPSIGITSYGVRRKYVDLLVSDRRYVNEYVLDGGFKAVDFNGIPIVPEKDCPEGTTFFLAEDHIGEYRMSDYYWLDKDGAILHRTLNRDSWEAILAYYMEQAIDRRNAQSVVGDIAI